MKINVTANGEQYGIDLDRLTFAEGRAIEKVTGGTFKDFGELLQKGSLLATQAIVWVAVKRSRPETPFSALDDWSIGDLDITEEKAQRPTRAARATPAA